MSRYDVELKQTDSSPWTKFNTGLSWTLAVTEARGRVTFSLVAVRIIEQATGKQVWLIKPECSEIQTGESDE